MVGLPRPVDHPEDDPRGAASARRLVAISAGDRYDDELWRLVPDGRRPPAHIVDFVRSLGGVERALDVGSGDGQVTVELQAAKLTVADVSTVALERARARLPDAELILTQPDAAFPLEDNAFDLVLCTETIEHVRDTQLFLSEIRRVLRPGGLLALTTPAHRAIMRTPDPFSPHLRHYTHHSLARALRALAFDVVDLRRRHGTLLARATR